MTKSNILTTKHAITLSELADFIVAHKAFPALIDTGPLLDLYTDVFDLFWKDPEYQRMNIQYDITQELYNIEVKHLL